MTSLLGASSELLVVATISLYQRLERLRLRLQSPLQLFFLGLTKDIVIQDPKSKQPKKGNAMETIVLILSRSFLKVRYSTSYTIQYHYYTLPTATNSNSPIVLLPLYLQSPLQFLFWVNQFYGQDPIMQILVIQKKELQWRLEVVTIYIYIVLYYYYYYTTTTTTAATATTAPAFAASAVLAAATAYATRTMYITTLCIVYHAVCKRCIVQYQQQYCIQYIVSSQS